MRAFLSLVSFSLLWASDAGALTLGSNPELDRLYEQASDLLAAAKTQRAREEAAGLLEEALRREPTYAPAYVELARFVLKSTYRFSGGPQDEFTEAGIQQATALLDTALQLEPAFTEAFILYGYVLGSQGRTHAGLAILDEAEKLGATSLWLALNRSQLQEINGSFDAAHETYLAVLQASRPGSSQYLAALHGLARLSASVEEVDRYLREIIDLSPEDQWAHGNYAAFLLEQGHFDAAIEHADRAMQLNPYPLVRETLAVALTAKASELLLVGHDEEQAAVYFSLAQKTGVDPKTVFFKATSNEASFIAVFGLVEQGMPIDTRDATHRTALFHALGHRDEKHVLDLLSRGANPNLRDEFEWTPLQLAVAADKPALVMALLAAGADPNTPGNRQRTPLDQAVEDGHEEIGRLLLTAGGKRAQPAQSALAKEVRAGSPTAFRRATEYLQLQDPEDTGVVAALQTALLNDPWGVLGEMTDYGFVLQMVCGAPVEQGASAQSRLDAVMKAKGAFSVTPHEIVVCEAGLRRGIKEESSTNDATLSPAQGKELLGRAQQLFEQSIGADRKRAEAEKLAIQLTSDFPDDPEGYLLRAELTLAEADAHATRDETHQAPLDAVRSAITLIELALRHAQDDANAYAWYAHALLREGHPSVARLLLQHANAIGRAGPWVAVFAAELSALEADCAAVAQSLSPVSMQTSSTRIRRASAKARIDCSRATGRLEDARASFEQLVATEPENDLIAREYLEFLLYERSDFSRAIEIGMRLNRIGAHVDDNRLLAQALFAQGTYLYENSAPLAEVAELFERARRQIGDPKAAIVRAAAHDSTFPVVSLLHRAGVTIDAADQDGNTPLLHAVIRGNLQDVVEALSLGANVDAMNSLGASALHIAIATRNEAIALKLLDAGATVSQRFPNGISVRDAAESQQLPRVVERLDAVVSRQFPDRATFLDGVRSAQRVHVERALAAADDSEAVIALETAMQRRPATVLEIASARGALSIVCGQSREATSQGRQTSMKQRRDALAKMLEFQAAIVMAPSPSVDRCVQALSNMPGA